MTSTDFLTLPLLLALMSAFIAGTLVMWLIGALHRASARWVRMRRFKRGAEGEAEACTWLKKHGFTIVSAQEETAATMVVDGTPREYSLRADYLAEKGGKRCLIEVKTGKRSVDPLFSDTRRQLLEYSVVYDVDTVFLFNADDGILSEISFPALEGNEEERHSVIWPILSVLLALLLVLLLLQNW